MELSQEKRPPENCHVSPSKHRGHSKPDSKAQQKPNHTPDHRPGHPQWKPHEYKQPHDTVLLDNPLARLRRGPGPLEYIIEPLERQQMPPAKNKQRIENKHHNRLNYDTDRDDRPVPKPHRVSKGHTRRPAEHDLRSRHPN